MKEATLKEQIANLQEKRIAEIAADTSINSIAKLQLLAEERLFPIGRWLQHEFREWEHYLANVINKTDPITDTIFDPSVTDLDKYVTVYYGDYLENILEGLESYDEEIEVITCRSNNTNITKPFREVCDKVFEFCLQNKICGYKNDW